MKAPVSAQQGSNADDADNPHPGSKADAADAGQIAADRLPSASLLPADAKWSIEGLGDDDDDDLHDDDSRMRPR